MSFSLGYRNITKQKKKIKISLSEEEAIEMAFFTEIPYDRKLTIKEIQNYVHEVQKRPWFESDPMSISKIRSFINKRILVNPRKNIEIDKDIYYFYSR